MPPDPNVQPPVVVVPGITATGLEDFYPIPPEEIWSAVLTKKYERISLHPDDVRYEAIEPARVQPRALFGVIYADLVEALRHDLSPARDRPTPVFPFAYDWRQDCARSAEQLRDFVQEVLDRSALLPHYRGKDRKPSPALRVDLVGHSLGGLVIADYLQRYGKERRVRRVATIGTPFEGSVDAIEKISTGMGGLTGPFPRDREREAARTIPAFYQLLPSYRGVVEPDTGDPHFLFDSDTWKTWQRSVLQTLGEYIRLHEGRIEPEDLLAQYLDVAWRHRERLGKLKLDGVLPQGRKGWMAIVGLGAPTRIKVEARARPPRWFDFPDPVDRWSSDPTSPDTGDGTIPLAGASPRFLVPDNLVCISPDELGALELRDKLLTNAAGFHAALPTVNLVQRLVLRFLREDYGGDVAARRAPGVTRPDWPIPQLQEIR